MLHTPQTRDDWGILIVTEMQVSKKALEESKLHSRLRLSFYKQTQDLARCIFLCQSNANIMAVPSKRQTLSNGATPLSHCAWWNHKWNALPFMSKQQCLSFTSAITKAQILLRKTTRKRNEHIKAEIFFLHRLPKIRRKLIWVFLITEVFINEKKNLCKSLFGFPEEMKFLLTRPQVRTNEVPLKGFVF